MDNIQVIERAFNLLETVALDRSRPHKLNELAKASNLKAPTAARIVKTMVNLGYLEHAGRKIGYTLGPMSLKLMQEEKFSHLIKKAKPLMQKFSDQLGEYIGISVLNNGWRVILYDILSTNPVMIHNAKIIKKELPYRSLAGRLLLSKMPRQEQCDFWDHSGLPGDSWPEINNESDFLNELAEIHDKKRIMRKDDNIASIAMPVIFDNKIHAALSVFLPSYRFKNSHRRLIIQLLEEMQEQIASA